MGQTLKLTHLVLASFFLLPGKINMRALNWNKHLSNQTVTCFIFIVIFIFSCIFQTESHTVAQVSLSIFSSGWP